MEQYIKNISTFFAVNEDSDKSIIYKHIRKNSYYAYKLIIFKG